MNFFCSIWVLDEFAANTAVFSKTKKTAKNKHIITFNVFLFIKYFYLNLRQLFCKNYFARSGRTIVKPIIQAATVTTRIPTIILLFFLKNSIFFNFILTFAITIYYPKKSKCANELKKPYISAFAANIV